MSSFYFEYSVVLNGKQIDRSINIGHIEENNWRFAWNSFCLEEGLDTNCLISVTKFNQ